jgi:hypothetical protein
MNDASDYHHSMRTAEEKGSMARAPTSCHILAALWTVQAFHFNQRSSGEKGINASKLTIDRTSSEEK